MKGLWSMVTRNLEKEKLGMDQLAISLNLNQGKGRTYNAINERKMAHKAGMSKEEKGER